MSVFSWLFGKKKDARANHDFSDDDRDLSIQVRRKKAEITLLKLEKERMMTELRMDVEKARLEDELAEYQEEEEQEDPNGLLMQLLLPIIQKSQNRGGGIPLTDSYITPGTDTAAAPMTEPQRKPTSVHLTDAELKKIWDGTPKMAKLMVRKLPDSVLLMKIQEQIPGIDDETLARAISIVKGG